MLKLIIDLILGFSFIFGLFIGIWIIGNKFSMYAFQWTIHELLSKKMFDCLICDLKNFFNFLLFIFLVIIVGLILYITIPIFQEEYTPIFMLIEIFFLIGIFFVLLEFLLNIRIKNYKESINIINQFRNQANIKDSHRYHAIIVVKYGKESSNYFIGDTIKLLVQGFEKERIPFKIFLLESRKDFFDLYSNDKIIGLWIFGHGTYSSLYFDDGNVFYRNLPENVKTKEFIGQFHCNPGEGVSLIDKNSPKKYFITNYLRIAMQNRCYLIKRFSLKE